jgi:hypothetical protein
VEAAARARGRTGPRTPRQEAWRRHTVVSAVDTGKFWPQMGIGGPSAGPAEIGRALGLGPN